MKGMAQRTLFEYLLPAMAFPRRRPHVASPDEVRITRKGDAAIIEYGDPEIPTTNFVIGSEKLAGMTDDDILELWNSGVEATDELWRPWRPDGSTLSLASEASWRLTERHCGLRGHVAETCECSRFANHEFPGLETSP